MTTRFKVIRDTPREYIETDVELRALGAGKFDLTVDQASRKPEARRLYRRIISVVLTPQHAEQMRTALSAGHSAA